MSENKISYSAIYQPYIDYNNPWERAKEGCWIIRKKDGTTSTRRLTEEEMVEGLEQVHYAMAVGCDIMMRKMLDLQNSGRSLSISDIVFETINAVGSEIKRRKNEPNVGS